MVDQHSAVFYRKHKHVKPTITHGKGIYFYDADGVEYIDASGGAVVVNVGHGVTEIADAMGDQAAQVAYAHASMFTTAATEKLARRLAACLPMSDPRLFFLTSGSEAVETAIKFARQAQMARGQADRYKVIGRWGSYHGATLGSLAVMGKPSMRKPYEIQFRDMPHIPPVYCYRCPFGLTYPDCALRCADELEHEILRQGPETVAAFIAEPIAGATLGAVVPPGDYWQRIRDICDAYGVLLIIDEVMTGVGRTGRWFATEQWDVEPDLMTLGKGISGGYTALSAAAVRGEWVDLVWDELGDFNHGGTFSHQPVASAAGNAALDYIEAHDLVARSARLGALLGQKLHAAFDDHPHVGDIRGQGLMWGLEFVADRATAEPFPPTLKFGAKVFDHAFANGLIVYPGSGSVDGVAGDHLMVAPPFVVTEDQLDEIILRLSHAISLTIDSL